MRRWITILLSGMMLPDADGFEQNTAIEDRQQGICGDVAGNVIPLSNYIRYSGYLLNRT